MIISELQFLGFNYSPQTEGNYIYIYAFLSCSGFNYRQELSYSRHNVQLRNHVILNGAFDKQMLL